MSNTADPCLNESDVSPFHGPNVPASIESKVKLPIVDIMSEQLCYFCFKKFKVPIFGLLKRSESYHIECKKEVLKEILKVESDELNKSTSIESEINMPIYDIGSDQPCIYCNKIYKLTNVGFLKPSTFGRYKPSASYHRDCRIEFLKAESDKLCVTSTISKRSRSGVQSVESHNVKKSKTVKRNAMNHRKQSKILCLG